MAVEKITGQLKSRCYCMADFEECDDFCLSDFEELLLGPYCADLGGFNVILNDDGYWVIDAAP